jgi:hypothetical protein
MHDRGTLQRLLICAPATLAGTNQAHSAGGDAGECAESDGGSRVKRLGDGADDRRADGRATDKGGRTKSHDPAAEVGVEASWTVALPVVRNRMAARPTNPEAPTAAHKVGARASAIIVAA